MKHLTILFFLVFCLIAPIAAQTGKTISGIIKDPNGELITGAQVALVSQQKQLAATTDASGAFSFDNVLPGNYELRVTANGFKTLTRAVKADDAAENLDIVLGIGEQRVTVTAELGQAEELERVPQSVTLIGREEIAERSNTVLAEAGREEVGVNIQLTSPSLGEFFIRGLTGKNVNVYVDNVRFTTGAQRGGISTFFNLNEPTNLQSIELLRGPNGALYGSDSLGGTVALRTRNPVLGGDESEFHGEINTSYYSASNSPGASALFSYGTNKLGGYVNLAARRANTLRPANGIDSHAAVTRFLGLPSSIINGDRLPDTAFTQYGGNVRLNYAPTDDQQFIFSYQRSQQDGGKRYDQLLGGDGNLIADLRNLMLDFGYLRYAKQNLGFFDSGAFTVSYNSQREERVNQGGQGDPFGGVTHQYERTTAIGGSFFLDKRFRGNSFLVGGDIYRDKVNAPAYTLNPRTGVSVFSRPRVPDEARFTTGGVFIQDAVEIIPQKLRVSGALRYNGASYRSDVADSPIVNNLPLFGSDKVNSGDFSGRIGAVISPVEGLRFALNYSRGFRAPNITDLGTLGLTGTGFEVDFSSAANLGGIIGTTADRFAVSTGIPVSQQGSEYTNNYDASIRFNKGRFETELTGFYVNLKDQIVKQSLILPQGAVGRFLGDQAITSQLPNGVVFVGLSTTPVLVRTNFSDARIFGVEYELETRLTSELKFKGNFTYIRQEDTRNGLPPNIEGGTPPPTGFLSLRYDPAGKPFSIEAYAILADKQNRLSTLDLEDRRTGATRSRAQIQNFFRRGACVRGLTNNPNGVCGTGDETILLATGETLLQVQNRILGVGVDSAPLFRSLPGYALFNLRGSYRFGERSQIFASFENIFDQFNRNPSWGVDGAGRSIKVAYRYQF